MSDSSRNGNGSPKTPESSILRAEEATVTAILQSKLQAQDILREEDRQLVAYRIAEIMVAAKELYTKELPRLASEKAEPDSDLFSELAGLRMSFLHIRDLITDFDEAFMISMSHVREDDEDDESEDENAKEEPPQGDSSCGPSCGCSDEG